MIDFWPFMVGKVEKKRAYQLERERRVPITSSHVVVSKDARGGEQGRGQQGMRDKVRSRYLFTCFLPVPASQGHREYGRSDSAAGRPPESLGEPCQFPVTQPLSGLQFNGRGQETKISFTHDQTCDFNFLSFHTRTTKQRTPRQNNPPSIFPIQWASTPSSSRPAWPTSRPLPRASSSSAPRSSRCCRASCWASTAPAATSSPPSSTRSRAPTTTTPSTATRPTSTRTTSSWTTRPTGPTARRPTAGRGCAPPPPAPRRAPRSRARRRRVLLLLSRTAPRARRWRTRARNASWCWSSGRT